MRSIVNTSRLNARWHPFGMRVVSGWMEIRWCRSWSSRGFEMRPPSAVSPEWSCARAELSPATGNVFDIIISLISLVCD